MKSEKLVANLIKYKTTICKKDDVIDIGFGKGIISYELVKYANKVYAFEIDRKLVEDFIYNNKSPNIKIIASDFLKFDIEKFGQVKVFANIPFFLTADIVRKIFLENSNVKDGYLFMEKQAAWRFMGNSILGILLNTFYKIRIEKHLHKTDFVPAPDADVVFVSFQGRANKIEFRSLYYDFVAYLFNLRKNTVKLALIRLFTYEQTKRLARDLKLSLDGKISDMSKEQWISLYNFFLTLPQEKHIQIVGEFAKIMRHQKKQNKSVKIVQ